jgi:hypothetical protein
MSEQYRRLGFQAPMLRRRALRRRNMVFAELITPIALVVSIAVVVTTVTIGICRAAPPAQSHAEIVR